jgi:polyhydroxybutyrate depolymerase
MSPLTRCLLYLALPLAGVLAGYAGLGVVDAHGTGSVAVLPPWRPTTTGAAATHVAAPTAQPAPVPAPPVTTNHTVVVDGRVRQWEQLTPSTVGASTPILVVLHGQAVTVAQEVQRDGLVPLVAQGRAELVYPAGIGMSWNAGGCCGPAAVQSVDDTAFVRALVAQVDPGHGRPVHLVGYSNGGRLAYAVACSDPTLVDDYAVVDAMPYGCAVRSPVTILQVDGTADPAIPYQPGDAGAELPPATTQVAALRVLDGCAATPSTVRTGTLVVATYAGCADGHRLRFASYVGGTHLWPAGDATTPNAAEVVWAFVSPGTPW